MKELFVDVFVPILWQNIRVQCTPIVSFYYDLIVLLYQGNGYKVGLRHLPQRPLPTPYMYIIAPAGLSIGVCMVGLLRGYVGTSSRSYIIRGLSIQSGDCFSDFDSSLYLRVTFRESLIWLWF